MRNVRTVRPHPAWWAVAGVIFAATTILAMMEPPVSAEVEALLWIERQITLPVDPLMSFLDAIGGVGVISAGLTILAVGLLLADRRREASIVAVAGATALVANIGLKVVIDRPRPELWLTEVDSLGSYPSGHALLTTVLCGLVVALVWQTRWRWPVAVGMGTVILLMGFSRLYLGEHYITDVVGSYCLALLIVMSAHRLFGLPAILGRPIPGTSGVREGLTSDWIR